MQKSIKLGSRLDTATEMGPFIPKIHVERVNRFVTEAATSPTWR